MTEKGMRQEKGLMTNALMKLTCIKPCVGKLKEERTLRGFDDLGRGEKASDELIMHRCEKCGKGYMFTKQVLSMLTETNVGQQKNKGVMNES